MERKKQISERWLQNVESLLLVRGLTLNVQAKEGLVHSSECDEVSTLFTHNPVPPPLCDRLIAGGGSHSPKGQEGEDEEAQDGARKTTVRLGR
eukprot:761323-Hanusia_phi.AAC.2